MNSFSYLSCFSNEHKSELDFLCGFIPRNCIKRSNYMFFPRFISFCRVGTGLSDDELDAVVTKLKPYFRYLSEVSTMFQIYINELC